MYVNAASYVGSGLNRLPGIPYGLKQFLILDVQVGHIVCFNNLWP